MSKSRSKMIVLASRTEDENMILAKKLAGLGDLIPGGIRLNTTRPQVAKLEVSGDPDLVVFNFNEWNPEEIQYVTDLRASGYTENILILAKADVPTAAQNLRSLEKVVYLEKPFEPRDLVGIAQKALLLGEVEQQHHKRYTTEQEALVEFQRGAISSRVFNMSKTGAYLELNTLREVKVGETVRLRLELEAVNRTYLMPAKVIWTQTMGRTGGTGIGLHFTGKADIKKHMFQV